jgi:hypothetical protein
MSEKGPEPSKSAASLLTRGEVVLEGLRSVAKEAAASQVAFLDDAKPLFEEVDAVLDKHGVSDSVRPALDYLASAALAMLQREVRFFDLLSEIETIHEDLFALVSSQKQ